MSKLEKNSESDGQDDISTMEMQKKNFLVE